MEEVIKLVGIIITVLIGPFIAYKFAVKKTKDDFYNKALQNRYYLVYSPLRNLLLETHITGASIGLFFKARVKKALVLAKNMEFRKAFKLLCRNYKENQLYEVEFGNEFPLESIKEIVKKQGKWADAKLLNLIQNADRSSYETWAYSMDGKSNGLLEQEKFNLAEHIWDQYEELNRRILPR